MNPTDASNPAKIGILDSGVGGLSVLAEIRRLLPAHPIHYVGDSAWCPYGNKSPDRIRGRVADVTDHLLENGAGIIVMACNSATIHAVGALRATYPLPIVGMEPAVKPAAGLTRSGVVGVLATEASFAGEKFHHLVSTHANGIRVITHPCPRFVELVEAGELEGLQVEEAVDEAVAPLLEAGADVMVLGCTHYPFLRRAIEARLPDDVTVVDTGPAVARQTARLIPQAPDFSRETSEILIETTGALDHLDGLLPRLLPGLPVASSRVEI